LLLVLLIVALGWLISGFYTVDSQQQGIVLRFGRIVTTTGPGMHWAWPWPVDRVLTPTTTDVRRLEVGFRFLGEKWPDRRFARRSDMLTGDENILKVMMVVQYKLRDPVAYLFACQDQQWLVERSVESALSAALAQRTVDDVLTSAKAAIQVEAIQAAQELLDRYGVGIVLLGGNLQVVSPPEPVIAAFNEVTAAKKDSERVIEDARTYAHYVVPGARGEAAKRLAQAQGDRHLRVDRARGDAERFLGLLGEYRTDPQLTRQRLYLESFERIFAKAQVVVVDDDERMNVIGE
jgi:membrane protease subunit HflK